MDFERTRATPDGGLEVVLHWLVDDYRRLRIEAAADLGSAERTNARVRSLQARTSRIAQHLGVPVAKSEAPELAAVPGSQREQALPLDWPLLRARAADHLRSRGVDPDTVSLDELLEPESLQRIAGRFSGAFSVESRLDRYDVLATVSAGLEAALVDFLIVRIPTDITYLGEHLQKGSPVTGWLRSFDVPVDNTLARWFKVSFDRVHGVPASGYSARTHRLQTPGHDPLIGLVVGAIDIMRGGLTAIGTDGRIAFMGGQGEPVYNPIKALVHEIGHLLSDGATKMGIPAPGWSLTHFLQLGSFGERERTVAELARFMYLKGFDSRHFLAMSTSVVAAEIVLRSYFWLRRTLDDDYSADCDRQAHLVGSDRTADHPRFISMSLGAHGIGAAANAGKVGFAYAGNPLAINYAQWLRFLHALYAWFSMRVTSPTDLLIRQGEWNLRLLERGWPDVDADGEGFPVLDG